MKIKEYEYTGTGLFVHFERQKEIEAFKIINDKILNGLFIKSIELELGAEAILFVKRGIIDYLEIWSHSGNYPKFEITKYELIDGWIEKKN